MNFIEDEKIEFEVCWIWEFVSWSYRTHVTDDQWRDNVSNRPIQG